MVILKGMRTNLLAVAAGGVAVAAGLVATGLLATVAAVTGPGARPARADDERQAVRDRPGGPILHEFLPGVRGDEVDLILGHTGAPGTGDGDGGGTGAGGGGDGDTAGPAAPSLLYQGTLLSRPEDEGPVDGAREVTMSALPGDGQAGEAPGRRSPTFRPDRMTELEGTLGYYASFNPTVAPFKRVTAFDAVALEDDGTPVLVVAEPGAQEPLPVVAPSAGADEPRDRFWGSVVLDFRDGPRVPLPTPGPDARILWWSADPETPLRFLRDGAENAFAVTADDAAPDEPVRLAFLVDVPRSYFGGAIPDVANDALAAALPPMDPALADRARTFAAELGVRRGDPLPRTLRRLVAHFRAFEESAEAPVDSGDVYLDLARSQKGICRHRSYAFLITAQALGIPTRFAMNEAHSWVEVALPGRGWLRIDLGGAAAGLEAHGARDRVMHRPLEPDTLPKPLAYQRSYSQLQGDVRGLPEGPIDPSRPGPAGGLGGLGGSTPPAAGMSRRPAVGWSARDGRDPVQLTVDGGAYTAFRGRDLTITGRAVGDDGDGRPGLRVEVLLEAPGEERLLGVAVTDARGYYQGDFGVPPGLTPGRYRLTLRFPGDARHAPAAL